MIAALSLLLQVEGRFPAGRVPRELASAIDALRRAPEHAHSRISSAIGVVRGWQQLDDPAVELCPQYPRATRLQQARVVLGDAPSKILRGLTAREAHDALTRGYESAVDYVLSAIDEEVGARDVETARWIVACRRDPARWAALSREHAHRGPHGEEIRGTQLSRIDEITRKDLPRGPSTGVQVAFDSASRRAWNAWQRENEREGQPLTVAPRWWRPIRCARLLLSAADLVAEGRRQRHCVGAYSGYVRRGESVIVSLCVRGRDGVHRSTVELSRDGQVRQHKGPDNGAPHALCAAALAVCRRRWNLTTGERKA